MQIQGSTFENDIVELDWNVYEHCHFRHCILVYRGGPPPRFAQCTFFQCAFRFDDAAGHTLSFLTSLYHSSFKPYVEQTLAKICTDRRRRPRAPTSCDGAGEKRQRRMKEPPKKKAAEVLSLAVPSDSV